jgi:hypothetical protein
MMRGVIVVVALGLLVLALSACGTNHHREAAKSFPACRGNQISISFVPDLGVALGNRHGTAVIRNVQSTACFVRGYLRLRLLDAGRRIQTTHVVRGGTYFESERHSRTVVIPPNSRATADIAWSIEPRRGESSVFCEPPSWWIEITVPSAHEHSILRFIGDPVCAHGQLFTTALARSKKTAR